MRPSSRSAPAGSCTDAACGSTLAGDYTVTGTDGLLTDTATLHVTAAALDHIVISPASATIAAGATQTYTAEGFDVYDNSRGSVTGATIFTISAGGTCTDAACGSTLAGDYTVTGTDGVFTDTATLHVTAAALDHIVISPASATIAAGATQAYTAEGFDTYGNTRGSVTGATIFTISAGGLLHGRGLWINPCRRLHRHRNRRFVDRHRHPACDRSSPGSHRDLPRSATIAAGATQTYTAEGFDVYDNSRGSVTGATIFTISAADPAGRCLWINPCRRLHGHRNRWFVHRHRHPACDRSSPGPHRDLPRFGDDRRRSHPDLHR